MDQVITCGGIKIPFGYCRELQKRGIDSCIYANGRNKDLEDYYGVEVKPIAELSKFTDDDVIVAVWWKQVPEIGKYKGKKVQFVQGNDLESYVGDDEMQKCLNTRNMPKWDILAVSDFAGRWTGRSYTVVHNAIDDGFFVDLGLDRDIDALIEGNSEANKGVDVAVNKAKADGHKKIVWLATQQLYAIEGVERITNPPQSEIPAIYQRSKHFYKYSKSEGFCLPLWEAIASGCKIHTQDMGGNEGLEYTMEQAKKFNWENSTDLLVKYLNNVR